MSNTVKLPTCPKCGVPIPKEAPQGLCPKCVLLGAATGTEQGVPATATSEIPSIERIAAAFPQLEILELIGRGGMGFVFKARQPHLDRFVALKLLPDKLAKDAQFAERFNREGRVLAKLNHPNIVSVYDFGQAGGFYYLSMEYVDGVNLRQAMRAGRFSPAEALSVVPKVCEALQYAHEQGILHRDIKPENILLDAKGRVKIADFGIAKLVGEDQPNFTLTNTGAALGTPHYMAPEQLEKPATVDHRADIYSLGVVFYEMLTGELPIGRFAAPSSKTPVNASVDDIVFRTLEKDRERRFQSAGEMKTQVEGLPVSPEVPGVPPEEPVPVLGPHGTVVSADAAAVRRPGIALFACGVFNWIASVIIVLIGAAYVKARSGPILEPEEFAIVCVSLLVTSCLVMIGGWKMIRLESYRLAVLGSVMAMITSPGSLIGLPIGLWAFLTLRRPAVRAAFQSAAARSGRPGDSGVSRWSIYGSLLVGLSLPVPLMTLLSILLGRGGVGVGELWLSLGSVAMPGLGGTLLGWLGLNEIREAGGRVRGLPLAMFATLMWPLTILGALTVGAPMFLLMPAGEATLTSSIGRFLVLLLPAAVIAFCFWTIHSTARWAGRQPIGSQRNVLKWVFIGVIVVGMGLVLLMKPGQPPASLPAPQPMLGFTPAETIERPAPIRANFRFAKGHVVTFQVMRRIGEDNYEPVPHFAGYAVAPDDERGRFSLALTPEPSNSSTNVLNWSLRMVSETGGSAVGSSAPLGELISMLPTNHWHQIEPDASFGLYLTRAYPGAETNGITPLAELSLEVRSAPRGKVGVGPENTSLSLGSTNWTPALRQLAKVKPERRAQPGEVLANQWLKSPVGTNTTNWIRFTFTNVELRNEDGQQWLTMGYVTDIQGACTEVFVVDATGFEAVTRKTSWRTTPSGGSPVEYSGIQWLVPPGIDAATLESFRNSVAEALVAKSFVIPEGEQRPLIRFPVGKAGILSVGIGAKLKPASPNVQGAASDFSPAPSSWTPVLAPGELPDPTKILQEAQRLASDGRFEDALQRHLWYHNHALEYQPALSGVRLSFALASWAELGRRYPKARAALVEIRDRNSAEFDQGGGYGELFQEVAAINRELNDPEATLSLFKAVDARDPVLARQCYPAVEAVLLQRGEYVLCLRYLGDPQRQFEQSRNSRARLPALLDRTPEADRSRLLKEGDRAFIERCRTLVEVLVGVGRRPEAEGIHQQALAVLTVPALESALVDAEARVKSTKPPMELR